jgi:hypothetical protein
LSLIYTVAVDIAGKDYVPAVSGLLAFSAGIGVLSMGPLSGQHTSGPYISQCYYAHMYLNE